MAKEKFERTKPHINIGTIDATTTTVTNANPNTGTASQIRMISMTITYAE